MNIEYRIVNSECRRTEPLQRIHHAIDEEFPAHLDRCREFLRQKSISASGEGVRETALWVKDFLESIGAEVVFRGIPSHPIVYGRLKGAGSRTLIIYAMYDVQPAEEPNWISPPFAADIHSLPGLGECVVARGAVNSKGSLCGLLNVLSTIRERDRIPLNLIFAIDGEEEIGSPGFETFIRSHREELTGDGVVDFDFSQDSRGKVQVHLGLKGIVYLDLVCRGSKSCGPGETSLHSSASAWISSPVWRLVHALSGITDRKEDIRIPGIYDNAAQPDSKDLMLLEKLAKTFDEKAFLREMKSLCFKDDRHGLELLKQGLYFPTINIDGLHAGYTGAGTKTILPRKASAKMDIRFGPNMEPEEVVEKFKKYLQDQGFADIEITVRDHYTWSKTDFSKAIVQKMLDAYRSHGIEPEIWPMATWAAPYFVFSRILGLPVISGGLGHGGRQHVANEYMTVSGLRDFEKFVATFLYRMAEETEVGDQRSEVGSQRSGIEN